MKKLLMVLAVVFACSLPATAEASLVREAGRGCLFGGTVLAGTTYIGATPFLIGGIRTFTGYSLLVNNAVIGCALGAAGGAMGSIWSGLYDFIF